MKFAIKPLIVAAAMASMLSGAQAATLTVIGLAPGSTTYTKLAPLPPALQFSAAGAIIIELSLNGDITTSQPEPSTRR